jgi:hypothetical protein
MRLEVYRRARLEQIRHNTIRPHVNGLSDHDAQSLYLNNTASYNCITSRHLTSKFNDVSRNEFLTQ